MKQIIPIYIDRLKDGHKENIFMEAPPSFMGIAEPDLRFQEPVQVNASAYLAQTELIVQMSATAQCRMPCSICNEEVAVPLKIDQVYLAQPLDTIKGAIYDLADALREALLLELPAFVECCQGRCPQREQIGRYLKQEGDSVSSPFSHLRFKDSHIVEEP